MACGGDPRGKQAKKYGRANNSQTFADTQRYYGDIALIEPGKPGHWLFQQIQPVLHQRQGRRAAKQRAMRVQRLP